MNLNIRWFDGDRTSSLSAVSLTSVDLNLHQHGRLDMFRTCVIYFACTSEICTLYIMCMHVSLSSSLNLVHSNADVDFG